MSPRILSTPFWRHGSLTTPVSTRGSAATWRGTTWPWSTRTWASLPGPQNSGRPSWRSGPATRPHGGHCRN